MKGQLGNGPLVKKPTWNPTIRDNGSIGNVSTWIMFYWKLYLGLNHLGIRGLPFLCTRVPGICSEIMGLPKPRPHSKLQTPHSKMTVAFEWVNIFECLKILVKADIHN